MTTILLDENNDLTLNNVRNLSTVSGIDAVLQSCKNATMALLGEMIYNTDQGIPYFDVVWNGNPNLKQAEFYLRDAIENIDGVVGVQSMTLFVSDNVLHYNTTIETIYGVASYGV